MIEDLRRRRSIRRYCATPVPSELVEQLKEAVLRAPSSRGLASRRFVFVTDPAVLEALSRAKKAGAGFLAGAPLGVVVCGDEAVSDVWVEDCAIAAIIGQLTATSVGLGSCWIQMRNRTDAAGRSSEDVVREILGLSEPLRVDCVLAIGFPAEEKPPVPADRLDYDCITEV